MNKTARGANRIEVAHKDPKWDVKARRILKEIPLFFPEWKDLINARAITTELYFVLASEKWATVKKALTEEILNDPLTTVDAQSSLFPPDAHTGMQWWCLEKSFRPGVTDSPGQVLAEAVRLVTDVECEARTGSRLWIELPREVTAETVKRYADEVFYNGLIEKAQVMKRSDANEKDESFFKEPQWFEFAEDAGANGAGVAVESFELREMTAPELYALSQKRLWALTKKELEAIRSHFAGLGRAMTDVEIEILAQTWSEHCKHKIFAAKVKVRNERDDIELPDEVDGVFKTYIRGATKEIPAPYLKSVFEDNAGIINVTPEWDCAIKVETHNSPSALDPYGGALTGIVGVNRDILGAGMGAKPIANVDVFCVGDLDYARELPPRLHHPRRILEGIRVGVEHGGNKSGIPTVTGAVVHHPGYLGKPLVYCGTIGLLPAGNLPDGRDLIHKKILPGDKIVMTGGRIGKDGIHGATFSSLEMNEESPLSAVQLGDPLTQRRVWDFLIEARDAGLYRAVTDNGAGGLSSSIGEMARMCGKKGGARMDVAFAKTKYPGLKPFELVISESQERMSFAVPEAKLDAFLKLSAARGVESSVLGEFEDSGKFQILYQGETVGTLDMDFLHEGCPRLELEAVVSKPHVERVVRYGAWSALRGESLDLKAALPRVLALPNVRSRREIVRQYDHEVQARTVKKPYGTPEHASPNDGAALRLSREGYAGIAIGLGLAPFAGEIDPKVGAELSVDEALRNALVSGMDPAHAVLVDNFCWPDPLPADHNPDALQKMGALVTTCKRLFDAAVTLRMPFVSGKDSMKNDYRMGDVKISVPPTILVTAMGKVQDVRKIPKGHAIPKRKQTVLWVSGQDVRPDALGLPRVSFAKANAFATAFHELVLAQKIDSAHDVSDGGWLATTAEMLFGTGMSAHLNLEIADQMPNEPEWASLFGEPATSFVLMVSDADAVKTALKKFTVIEVGATEFDDEKPAALSLTLGSVGGNAKPVQWEISKLAEAYHYA